MILTPGLRKGEIFTLHPRCPQPLIESQPGELSALNPFKGALTSRIPSPDLGLGFILLPAQTNPAPAMETEEIQTTPHDSERAVEKDGMFYLLAHSPQETERLLPGIRYDRFAQIIQTKGYRRRAVVERRHLQPPLVTIHPAPEDERNFEMPTDRAKGLMLHRMVSLVEWAENTEIEPA